MIYITGSRGYIGSRLMKELARDLHNRDILIDESDLQIGRDAMSYEPVFDPDIIFHLAAQSGAMPSVDDPINDARQNILVTIKMIQIANFRGARLIFPTSGAALNPESPYGLSKKTCEEYIKMFCDDYVIVRLSSIFGEKPRGVVDTFIREDKCIVYGDGSAMRDFVHVDDIVKALILSREWDGGEYSLGSGKETTIGDIANATGKEIDYRESRKGEKHSVILENTSPSGWWKPEVDVLDYVKQKCEVR